MMTIITIIIIIIIEGKGMTIVNVITSAAFKKIGRKKNSNLALWLMLCLLMGANVAAAQNVAPKMMQTNDKAGPQAMDGEAYNKLLKDADKLLNAGKAAAAYLLLEAFEFELSGREKFDYLLGAAALDSGRPDRATLALERVLFVNPNSAAGRMEMARAYYQLGDMPRARTEFQIVLTLSSAKDVQSIVHKYLDKIAVQENGNKKNISAYIEATLGHDNNANNSGSQLQIFVDAIAANIVLDPTSAKTADQYKALALGGEIAHDINTRVEVFAGADARQRSFNIHKNFDLQGLDARVGMAVKLDHDRLKVGVSGGQNSLGGSHYSDSAAVKAEWRHVFNPSNQMSVFVQKINYSFVDVVMQPNDFAQQIAGVGWLNALPGGRSSLFASCYFGHEQDISTLVTASTPDGGRVDGAKSLQGIRVGGQTILTDSTTLFSYAAMQKGEYSKINPLFLRQRADDFYEVTIGTNWHWDKLWALRAQLNFYNNASNIAIYAYDRTDVSLTLHRDFR